MCLADRRCPAPATFKAFEQNKKRAVKMNGFKGNRNKNIKSKTLWAFIFLLYILLYMFGFTILI